MTSPYAGRSFLFDLETDGLLDQATRVHCAAAIDIDTGELLDFKPNQIGEFLQLYLNAKLLIGHNIIGYDCAVIEKIYGLKIPSADRLLDTLNLARLCFPDIKSTDIPMAGKWKKWKLAYDKWAKANPDGVWTGSKAPQEFPGYMVGFHSLESWGYRLGEDRKGDYSKDCKEAGIDPWAAWNEAMHAYMIQDVRVNLKLYRHLVDVGFSAQSIRLETRVQLLCARMERNGWPFAVKKAEMLHMRLCAERDELAQSLRSLFPPWTVQLCDFIPKRDNKTKGYKAGVPVPRFETIEFNPSSRDHIAYCLTAKYGWKPEAYTEGGKPKVDDEVLTALPYPEAQALARYFLVQKRVAQLAEGNQAWLRLVKNGRIHGRYNTNGAVSGRATHSTPNVAQVPSVGAEYGPECRELFEVPEGWYQVGADQAGLELRCLGSFLATLDNGAYIQTLLHGDVHWENAKALFGLPMDTVRDDENPLHKKYRSVAKTFIYAFLYGAGDLKIGTVAGVSEEEKQEWRDSEVHMAAIKALKSAIMRKGLTRYLLANPKPGMGRKEIFELVRSLDDTQVAYRCDRIGIKPPTKHDLALTYKGQLLRGRFLEKFPALAELLKAVQKAAKKGWLKGLDGRTLPVRSAHAALNVLLQSAGAVVCKQWIVDAEDALLDAGLKHGWDGDFVYLGWVHDELQIAVREGHEERVCELLVKTAREAGNPFPTWRCPTDGDTKVGRNWKDCH